MRPGRSLRGSVNFQEFRSMHTRSRAVARLAMAGWLGLAVSVLSPASSRAAAPLEKSLPPSTIAYIKADSVAKLRAAFRSSQLGQLWADPAMKPLKDDILGKLDEASKDAKEKVGLNIGELLSLPQGTLALAIVHREDSKPPISGLLSADAGSKEKEMNELMTRLTGLAEKDNSKVSTETFKGLKLTTIQSTKEADKDAPPLVWTKQATVYYLATDANVLKDVLSHPDGREDSLATNEGYVAIQKKVGKDAQAFWFIDLARAIKLGTEAAGQQGGNAEQIVAQLQLMGLNALKAIGGGIGFNAGEYDTVIKTFAYSPGPAQGLLKVFSMPAVNLKPQAWVPASAATYQSFSWDLDNAYTAINDLADMFAPGVLGNLEKQLAGPNGQGLSFQKDVFGPIGDRITVISDFKKPITEKSERMLIAVALEDTKAFQNTFNKVLALAKASPKKREFQGTTIYDFDLSGLGDMGGGNLKIDGPLSVAIAKESLFLTPQPSLLEQVLRSGGSSLADSPEYQAVAKQMPEKCSTVAYERPEESARLLYDMVKSGNLGKTLEATKGANGPDLSKVAAAIDPNKLPEFSVFAKYISAGGGYSIMDEDGFTMYQFSLKKAAP